MGVNAYDLSAGRPPSCDVMKAQELVARALARARRAQLGAQARPATPLATRSFEGEQAAASV